MFREFLNSIKSEENDALLECIDKGFCVLMEGFYPDDSPISYERESTIDKFNTMAQNLAMTMGSDVLARVNSANRNRQKIFTVDKEPELDDNPTSEFINIDLVKKNKNMPTSSKDEDLGVFFGDLKV